MAKKNIISLESKKKKPAVKFSFYIIIIIFIITMGACFAMHMANANINDDEFIKKYFVESNSDTNTSQSNTAALSESTVQNIVNPVPQSEPRDNTYLSSCVFIGDSSVSAIISASQYIPSQNVISSASLSTINSSSITINDKTDSFSNVIKTLNPQNLYIMLGRNEITSLSSDKLIAEYKTLIKNIKSLLPDSKIYILALPPVTQTAEASVPNSEIDAFNSQLLEVANSQSVYFADTNTALKDNNGKLPDNYAENDSLTLNQTAYETICAYLLSHVAE